MPGYPDCLALAGVGAPRADTPFPKTHLSAKEVFGGIPPDEIDLMTHKNAEKLFKFPLNQDLVASYSATT